MRAKKWLLAAMGIAGLGFIGRVQAASTLQIALQEDGGAITVEGTATDFSAVSFTGTYGDFSVKLFGGSSDNGATLSDLLDATTSVTNNSASAHTLTLYVTQANYTLPVGTPLNVSSSMGVALTTSGAIPAGGATFQAYANNSNVGFDTTGAFTNGAQVAVIVPPGNLNLGTGTDTGLFLRSTSTSMYSLTGVTNFALAGNSQANFSDQIDVTIAPLPAAASTGLALLAGLGVLGGVSVLRRRRQTA